MGPTPVAFMEICNIELRQINKQVLQLTDMTYGMVGSGLRVRDVLPGIEPHAYYSRIVGAPDIRLETVSHMHCL